MRQTATTRLKAVGVPSIAYQTAKDWDRNMNERLRRARDNDPLMRDYARGFSFDGMVCRPITPPPEPLPFMEGI